MPIRCQSVNRNAIYVSRKTGKIDPNLTSEELSSYIKAFMEYGGAVTINMSIYQDGTVGKKALQVMREVKESIR